MEARTDNQELTYNRAKIAYEQQDYELAAVLIDKLVQNSPTDPNLHLLKGHTYYMLQQYDVAKDSYQSVLYLTSEEEVIGT